jgi:hypothetical protein
MASERNTVEKLRAGLLNELRLMTPADLRAYWKQVPWQKPDLVEWAKQESCPGNPTPFANALKQLRPLVLTEASKQLDPFGWLLDEAVDVNTWSNFCQKQGVPWMTRVWLAAASQMRADRRHIHKAHGWKDQWEKLRRDPHTRRKADEGFFAQLRHANQERQKELLAIPGLNERITKARQERDEAFLRRFRRAKTSAGKRAGLALAEKFAAQYWLEMPLGLPGLCFFSDSALHDLLQAFDGLSTGDVWATKQIRVRSGLIQAGAKQHLIEQVVEFQSELRFTGSVLTKPWIFRGIVSWDGKRRWPH